MAVSETELALSWQQGESEGSAPVLHFLVAYIRSVFEPAVEGCAGRPARCRTQGPCGRSPGEGQHEVATSWQEGQS